jgi:hypothetical protein
MTSQTIFKLPHFILHEAIKCDQLQSFPLLILEFGPFSESTYVYIFVPKHCPQTYHSP